MTKVVTIFKFKIILLQNTQGVEVVQEIAEIENVIGSVNELETVIEIEIENVHDPDLGKEIAEEINIAAADPIILKVSCPL